MTLQATDERPVDTAQEDRGRRRIRLERVPRTPPGAGTMVVSYALSLLALLLLCVVFNLTCVSQFQHWTAQHRLYGQLRLSLAEGSTPVGQTDVRGQLVALGTPVALLKIPTLGINEVVVEGTGSAQTKQGVGHRRDTPLPGQPGVVVLMGRQAAYGGVFAHLDRLVAGDSISITTGQGIARYRVIGQRTATIKLPGLSGDQGRLTLVTARGVPFMPSGDLIVDAALVSKGFPRPTAAIAPDGVGASEKPLASDRSGLVSLSWLMELLVLLAVGAAFAWKLWDRRAAWLVFTPLILVTSLACADRACDLLPNLL
ncbi:MAG: hypothetical protein JWR52_26 [Marmoricola sp.]|nr:hypothetical protein [Marmoricola sp.]